MDYLNWDLSILSRAVAYVNLSGAASHVGLSQPQLSRIVSKLEKELGLTLLDRSVRRKSTWTPSAYRLAEIYSSAFRGFQGEIQKISSQSAVTSARIGTLEGLMPVALEFSRRLLAEAEMSRVELDVYDLGDLEERFLAGRLEFSFSSREPGRRKHRYVRKLGYQTLKPVTGEGGASGVTVVSPFEYGSRGAAAAKHSKDEGRVLISNSLQVREAWINRFGGKGVLPSKIRPQRAERDSEGEVPALLIGQEGLPDEFWTRVAGGAFKI